MCETNPKLKTPFQTQGSRKKGWCCEHVTLSSAAGIRTVQDKSRIGGALSLSASIRQGPSRPQKNALATKHQVPKRSELDQLAKMSDQISTLSPAVRYR